MNNRYSIQEIAGMLATKTGKSKADSERFLKVLFSCLPENLCKDKLVKVRGLGMFKLVIIEERESVNVNTGECFIIPRHYRFLYLPDKELKELINEPFSFFETTELTGEAIPEIEKIREAERTAENDTVKEETIAASSIAGTDINEETTVINPAKPRKKNIFTAASLIITVVLLGMFIYFHSAGFFNTPPEQKSLPAEVVAGIPPAEEIQPVETDKAETFPEEALPSATPDSSGILGTETITEGSRLTLISLKHYGHKKFWVYIYEYNRDVISNPNQINIGTVIKIPVPGIYGIDAGNPGSVEKARQLEDRILSDL